MNLKAPGKVRALQRALYAKAKAEPEFRFYTLYDKVYREDVLAYAYACARANGGKAGIDGVTFEHIESYGVDRWLGELAYELETKQYRAEAVRRVHIPKADGKTRPLGIPTIRDRVAQTAVDIVLEPILEADFLEEQYAYRPKRSALDAIRHVHTLINRGHREVVEGDLSGYFDGIPHPELMKSVARRVSDGQLLSLIKQWLEVAVEEKERGGRRRRTTENKDKGRGVPQGAPISPLLSNLYMRRFVLGWKSKGLDKRLRAHIVNYADDFVICCRGTAEVANEAMQEMMSRLKLTVNEQKTHLCRLPEESFDFLGYTIGRCYSPKTGKAYLGTRPSRKSISRICRTVHAETERRYLLLEEKEVVARLNRKIGGWANYFRLGPVSKAYRAVDRYAKERLRRWLRKKHGKSGRGYARYPDEFLYKELGLINLPMLRRDLL